jgi:hypothetical protein
MIASGKLAREAPKRSATKGGISFRAIRTMQKPRNFLGFLKSEAKCFFGG